jgi:hypothetical protein
MTLYEIDQKLMELVDPETGELLDYEAFAAFQMEREEKIENMGLWVKELSAESAAIKQEIDNLTKRKTAADKKAESLKRYLSLILNGQKFKITLDKDPDFYYIGRCSINDHKCDKKVGTITVDLRLQPWKLKQELTVYELKHSSNWFGEYFAFQNLKKPAKVTVTCSTAIKLGDIHGDYSLSAGTHILSEPFVEGENVITIDTTEAGKITISYQEGCL